ncbi:MAG: DNA-processing protein DprA [Pseudomonadales bacterium]
MDLDTETRALLALNCIAFAHPRYGKLLIDYFGSAREALELADATSAIDAGIPASAAGRIDKNLRCDITQQLDQVDRWLSNENHFILSQNDPDYPVLLREIHDPPLLLYCNGVRQVLGSLKFAMVGSRGPTRAGELYAREFARQFASAGVTVTSGLAIGIDGASHKGALEGGGPTIAVLGTGCDLIYPARHRKLADAISRNGLLVSEFPLGTNAVPGNFPQRNRVVTGLSLGTLVVQATLRSGSLVSARLAMEQGRDVFAVPGSINENQSRGCHHLIKQGAKLTETLKDVEEELDGIIQFELESFPEAGAVEVTSLQARLIAEMSHEPVSVDVLTERIGEPVGEISAALVQLEIHGAVERRARGFALGNVSVRKA